MSYIIIINETEEDFIKLNNQEAIDLELKLNVTSKKHEWKHIGDVLYNFGANKQDALSEFTVTLIQFEFLKMLTSKLSYIECINI